MFGQPQKSSCPKHCYFRLIVSTTCVDFFVCACFTVVKRPVLALRPIFEVFLAIGYSFHGKFALVMVGGRPPTTNFEVTTYSGTRIGHARNPNELRGGSASSSPLCTIQNSFEGSGCNLSFLSLEEPPLFQVRKPKLCCWLRHTEIFHNALNCMERCHQRRWHQERACKPVSLRLRRSVSRKVFSW